MEEIVPSPEAILKSRIKESIQSEIWGLEDNLDLSLKDFLNVLRKNGDDDLYTAIIHSAYFKKYFDEDGNEKKEEKEESCDIPFLADAKDLGWDDWEVSITEITVEDNDDSNPVDDVVERIFAQLLWN